MNKKEAAAFLNVSEKTLERLVKRGELSARMEKGKTRDVVIFDDQELARYKDQREQPTHLPSVVREDTGGTDAPSPIQSLAMATQTNLDNKNRQAEAGSVAHLAEAMQSLADAQRMAVLQNKPTLSVHDAVSYSGLSKKVIDEAVKNGKLKTLQGSRGAKVIKRMNLDQFINELS